METEQQLLKLIAMDRIEIPISSLSGKLKRQKPKFAVGIAVPKNGFEGERVYAKIEDKSKMKARGMKQGIEVFSQHYPKHGKILQGMIEHEREQRETHLYFEMYEGKRLTSDDYMSVMTDLGFTEAKARDFYPELMEVSRNLSRKRSEERSVMIG